MDKIKKVVIILLILLFIILAIIIALINNQLKTDIQKEENNPTNVENTTKPRL